MPHFIVECSKDFAKEEELTTLLGDFHHKLQDLGLDLKKIKSRLKIYEHFIVGEHEAESKFIHCTLNLLDTRELEVLQKIGTDFYEYLKTYSLNIQPSTTVTFEIREMDNNIYYK